MHSLTPQLTGLQQLSAKIAGNTPEPVDATRENGLFAQELALFSLLGVDAGGQGKQTAEGAEPRNSLVSKTNLAAGSVIQANQLIDRTELQTGKELPQNEPLSGKLLPPTSPPGVVPLKTSVNVSDAGATPERTGTKPQLELGPPPAQIQNRRNALSKPLAIAEAPDGVIENAQGNFALAPNRPKILPPQGEPLLRQPELARRSPTPGVSTTAIDAQSRTTSTPRLEGGQTIDAAKGTIVFQTSELKAPAARDTQRAGLVPGTNLQLIQQQSAVSITSRPVRTEAVPATALNERVQHSDRVPAIVAVPADSAKSLTVTGETRTTGNSKLDALLPGRVFNEASKPPGNQGFSDLNLQQNGTQTNANVPPKPLQLTQALTAEPIAAKSLEPDVLSQALSTEQTAALSDDSSANPSPVALNSQAAPAARGLPNLTNPSLQFGDPNFQRQLNDHLLVMAGQGVHKAQLSLNPQELGPLDIRLAVNNDEVSVQLASTNAMVREALEQAMPRLKELFDNAGLKLVEQQVAHHFNDQGANRHAAQSSPQITTSPVEMMGTPHEHEGGKRVSANALVDTYI